MRSFILGALVAGGIAMSSGVFAQEVATLNAAPSERLVFVDEGGLSPIAKGMIRDIAGVASSGRTVELRGAPSCVDEVKRQLIADGVAPNAVIVRPSETVKLPSTRDAMPSLQEKSVEVRL